MNLSQEMRNSSNDEAANTEKQQDRFGISGFQEMTSLQDFVDKARLESESDPENQGLAESLEIAELKLELFRKEHDNAGAFKFNRFGRETRSMFEGDGERRPELSLDDEGRLQMSERMASRQMIAVNMGELDRFNLEGGHKAGDAGLAATAHAVEGIILKKISETESEGKAYTMLRFSGNEFMVSLDGFLDDEVREILSAVESMRPTVDGVSEGAPLTAESLSMREAGQIFDQLQAELPPDERIQGADEANRELIEVIKRRAQFGLEVGKFTARTRRVMEVMSRGNVSESQEFFGNFMAKMFRGTELDSLDRFEELSANGGDAWNEKVDRLALESARRHFDGERKFASIQDDIIRTRVRERTAALNYLSPDELLQSGSDRLAQIPEETRGQAVVRQMKEGLDESEKKEGRHDVEIARLKWQIEDARRDRGTGLLDRGSYYGALEKSLEQDRDVSVVFVDMGFLKYFDQKGGTEVGDAALKMASDVMERALDNIGAKGEVYRYGGDEFTIHIEGGEEAVKRLVREIHVLRDQAGRIPSGSKSAEEYDPTKLSFNYGACDRKLLDLVYQDLRSAGYYQDEQISLNKRAELMTVIADRGIEEEKAVERFQLLIRELRSPRLTSDAKRPAQVDSLMAYSEKAIFGRAGEEMVRRLAEDAEMDGAELVEEIRDFIAEQMESKRSAALGKDRLMDHLIDLRVQINQLEDRIGSLKGESSSRQAIIEKLRDRLQQAQAEREELLGLKKNLDE